MEETAASLTSRPLPGRPSCSPVPLSAAEGVVSSLEHPAPPIPSSESLSSSPSPSAPSLSSLASVNPFPDRRTGTIARLPRTVRRRTNEMLDDGYTYKAIIKAIGDVGAELNEDMMTRWKAGGYQDYLREQRLLEQCRMRTDRAYEVRRHSRMKPSKKWSKNSTCCETSILDPIRGNPHFIRAYPQHFRAYPRLHPAPDISKPRLSAPLRGDPRQSALKI